MALVIGQKAPDFCMETTRNLEALDHKAKLSDYLGKWLIVFFYPLDFTFVCPTEIRGFNSRLAEFAELNTEILGVSTDSVFCHRAWIKTPVADGGLGGLNYPLAADMTKQVSRDMAYCSKTRAWRCVVCSSLIRKESCDTRWFVT